MTGYFMRPRKWMGSLALACTIGMVAPCYFARAENFDVLLDNALEDVLKIPSNEDKGSIEKDVLKILYKLADDYGDGSGTVTREEKRRLYAALQADACKISSRLIQQGGKGNCLRDLLLSDDPRIYTIVDFALERSDIDEETLREVEDYVRKQAGK